MTFKTNILAPDEVQYLDADSVKNEPFYLSNDEESIILWKIDSKYYAELDAYYDDNFWQGEADAYERCEFIIEVEELNDEEVDKYFEIYEQTLCKVKTLSLSLWRERGFPY